MGSWLRAVSYFSLQSYCTRNLSTRATRPLVTRNEGVSPRRKNKSFLVSSQSLNNNIVVCNRAGWDKNWTDFKEKADCKQSTTGAIHSTKMPGNFGPKLNGSVRSNRKSFEKTGPPFEVDHFSRSDRLEILVNGLRPILEINPPKWVTSRTWWGLPLPCKHALSKSGNLRDQEPITGAINCASEKKNIKIFIARLSN